MIILFPGETKCRCLLPFKSKEYCLPRVHDNQVKNNVCPSRGRRRGCNLHEVYDKASSCGPSVRVRAG